VVAGRRQGATSELARAIGRTPGKAVGVELTRAAVRCGRDGGCFGRRRSSAGWGSSGGRWRWRHGPIVSARKREGESGLKWGQRWYMGGSHREEAEAVALRRGPERRGVSGGGSR
jgi:hypothetical protein